MVSRTAKVGQAFGSKGVLNNAAKGVVEEVGGGGVETVANDSAALGSGDGGALKFATNRKSLHMYDGAEWERIAGGTDAAPVITEDAVANSISAGTTDSSRVKFKVVDPEGFPISYTISYMRDSDKVFFTNESSNLPPILQHPAIITKADSGRATYKFITRTADSDGSGNSTTHVYKARYQGTDGARHAISTQNISLSFSTTFTFDTSSGQINAYGDNINKLEAYVAAGTAAAVSDELGKMGKGYLEYKIITDASYPMMGLVTGSTSGGYGTGTSIYLYHDGTYYGGGAATGLGASGNNDILMIAYDTDESDVWFGMNGSWGNKTPGTDAGYSITGGANGFRPAFHYGGGGATTYTIEIISHTTGAQYTIPSGWSLA